MNFDANNFFAFILMIIPVVGIISISVGIIIKNGSSPN